MGFNDKIGINKRYPKAILLKNIHRILFGLITIFFPVLKNIIWQKWDMINLKLGKF